MAASYAVWERRDGVDRNDFALAALQLSRRWRAHGVDSSKFYWLSASEIFIFNEGSPESLNVNDFNADPDNAAAAFAMDDLARMTAVRHMGGGRDGQETFQRAGSPSGT